MNTPNTTTEAKAKLTSHTDTRGNVWFTITRGDETLLETRDEDAANQMATDLGIMSCDEALDAIQRDIMPAAADTALTHARHTAGSYVAHGCAVYTAARLPNSEPGHEAAHRLVCVCPDTDCGSEYSAKENLPSYEEAAANARLIAAAPELLAALENLCADKYLADPINAERMREARAAIARATAGGNGSAL